MDLDIAGKRVGVNNAQLFSWHWPGDDQSTLPIATLIVNTTSYVNRKCCNRRVTRPQQMNPRALVLLGGA